MNVSYHLQQNTQAVPKQQATMQDGFDTDILTESDMQVTVERELVSQAEEEDMEALLDTYAFMLYLIMKFF